MIGHFFFNVRTIFVKGIRSWEWERTSSHMLRCTYKMREQVHLLQGTSKQYMVLSLIFFRISYLQKENSKGCVVGRGTGNGWWVSHKKWLLIHEVYLTFYMEIFWEGIFFVLKVSFWELENHLKLACKQLSFFFFFSISVFQDLWARGEETRNPV